MSGIDSLFGTSLYSRYSNLLLDSPNVPAVQNATLTGQPEDSGDAIRHDGFKVFLHHPDMPVVGDPSTTSRMMTPELSTESFMALVDATSYTSSSGLASFEEGADLEAKQSAYSFESIGYIQGPQPLFDNAADETAWMRDQISQFADVVALERDLKAEYGDDIKLAYDADSNSYLMLRPGDVGYDQARSTDQVIDGLKHDIRKGFVDFNSIDDILRDNGMIRDFSEFTRNQERVRAINAYILASRL